MSRLIFLIGKAASNIVARPLAAISSFLSLLLLFLLFDLVWIGTLTASHYYDRMIADIDMEIFIDDQLPDSSISILSDAIQRLNGVATVEFVSRDEARARLYDLMGTDLLEGFDENPLPRSLIVTFKPESLNSMQLESFTNNVKRLTGIGEIFYARDWLEKAQMGKMIVSRILLFLGLVILLTSGLNLIQTVRLSMRARWAELLQLNLLGAGRRFRTLPYWLEGVFYAVVSAVAGWCIIMYGSLYLSYGDIIIIYPSLSQILYFCFGAGVIGLLGAYVGSRRSL
jgi:cell division transport system permease protein